MPRSSFQKTKLFHVKDILLKYTDEEHLITVREIIEKLQAFGIKAERKSVYDDFETLRQLGVDVIAVGTTKNRKYYAVSDSFQLPELKLLVDAVQSSKFITHKKSSELIKKVENFCSVYEAKELQRFVYVSDRIKNENEEIYYIVDHIHSAILDDKKITFKYFEYTTDKKKVYKHDGALYSVSPMALIWADENYYLLAFDDKDNKMKHYRADKISKIEVAENPRIAKELFDEKDIVKYSRRFFGMFSGKEEQVCLEFDNHLIGVVLDKFGKDVIITKEENSFCINVTVQVSNPFYGWLAGFGKSVKIISPENVKKGYVKHITEILENT